ncbi:MAG: hypothetical protein K0S49_1846, partial [Microbacterium sp.]|nr:hypothetical protein [Microbacterium sp.]
GDAFTQREPREAQPLGLGVERRPLGLPFGVQLVFEILEEALPSHATRLSAA